MMISMAGLQVFIVRFFFQGARKGESLYLALVWLNANMNYSRLCMIMRLGYVLYAWHQSMGYILGFNELPGVYYVTFA